METLRAVLATGTIALDANVFHHLYRLGDQQRQQVLAVLAHDKICERLWLPYQAGLEYQRNRLSNAYDQSRVYIKLAEEVSKHGRQISTEFQNNISDPDVRIIPTTTLEKLIESLRAELLDLSKKHVVDFETARKDDPVRAALDALFDTPDKIGTKPDDAKLKGLLTECSKRYAQRIPPGYKDAEGPNKKPNPEGDYLIWRELLDLAHAIDRPLLFVTNDEKEDWYQRSSDGRIIGPRPELRAEMRSRSTHPYHQTTLTGFLRLVEQFLGLKVDQSTINQVDATIQAPSIFISSAEESYRYTESVISAVHRLSRDIEIVNNYTLHGNGVDFSLMKNSRPFAEVVVKYSRASIDTDAIDEIVNHLSGELRSVPILIIANRLYGFKERLAEIASRDTMFLVVEWATSADDNTLGAAIDILLNPPTSSGRGQR
ncbi:PIN-like domain-containing protein [Nocardia brasiliensis]